MDRSAHDATGCTSSIPRNLPTSPWPSLPRSRYTETKTLLPPPLNPTQCKALTPPSLQATIPTLRHSKSPSHGIRPTMFVPAIYWTRWWFYECLDIQHVPGLTIFICTQGTAWITITDPRGCTMVPSYSIYALWNGCELLLVRNDGKLGRRDNSDYDSGYGWCSHWLHRWGVTTVSETSSTNTHGRV